jgi:hypothetical protein
LRGQKSSRLRACTQCKWYGYGNCLRRTCHIAVPATCSAGCMGILLYASLPHQLSWLSPSFTLYCKRVDSAVSQVWSMTWNVHGCRSLCWGYLSVHNLIAAAPLPWALPRTKCLLAYPQNAQLSTELCMTVKEHHLKVRTVHWK